MARVLLEVGARAAQELAQRHRGLGSAASFRLRRVGRRVDRHIGGSGGGRGCGRGGGRGEPLEACVHRRDGEGAHVLPVGQGALRNSVGAQARLEGLLQRGQRVAHVAARQAHANSRQWLAAACAEGGCAGGGCADGGRASGYSPVPVAVSVAAPVGRDGDDLVRIALSRGPGEVDFVGAAAWWQQLIANDGDGDGAACVAVHAQP
eukprot:scaffold4811_cov69-Phaeocystis_antarctica.AAC.5